MTQVGKLLFALFRRCHQDQREPHGHQIIMVEKSVCWGGWEDSGRGWDQSGKRKTDYKDACMLCKECWILSGRQWIDNRSLSGGEEVEGFRRTPFCVGKYLDGIGRTPNMIWKPLQPFSYMILRKWFNVLCFVSSFVNWVRTYPRTVL